MVSGPPLGRGGKRGWRGTAAWRWWLMLGGRAGGLGDRERQAAGAGPPYSRRRAYDTGNHNTRSFKFLPDRFLNLRQLLPCREVKRTASMGFPNVETKREEDFPKRAAPDSPSRPLQKGARSGTYWILKVIPKDFWRWAGLRGSDLAALRPFRQLKQS